MLYTPGKTDCTPAEAGFDESRVEVLVGCLNRCFPNALYSVQNIIWSGLV